MIFSKQYRFNINKKRDIYHNLDQNISLVEYKNGKKYIVENGDYNKKKLVSKTFSIKDNSIRTEKEYSFINSNLVKYKIVPKVHIFYLAGGCNFVITRNEILEIGRSYEIKRCIYKIKNKEFVPFNGYSNFNSKNYPGRITILSSPSLYFIISYQNSYELNNTVLKIYEPKEYLKQSYAGADEAYSKYIQNENEDLCCTVVF